MKRGAFAALLAVVLGFFALAPMASPRGNDAGPTLAYLHAQEVLLHERSLALPAARADASGFVAGVAAGCPGALAHAPRNIRIGEALEEAFAGLASAFLRPWAVPLVTFAGTVEHLSWSNRRLTRLVALEAARGRAEASLPSPQLCSDLEAWVAGGYGSLPPSAARFLQTYRAVSVAVGAGGRSIDEEIHRLLVPYEDPAAKRRALALRRAMSRLRRLTSRALTDLPYALTHALGPPGGASGSPLTLSIAPPPAALRAGGRLLSEFQLGRTVATQSGCLACHRIGEDGNRGPGRDLTYVGSRLSPGEIERALIHPAAPMPSFKKLPKAKLRALVTFLSLLRR